MATLRIHSYTARGYSEIYTDQSRVGEFNPIYDVYRAVDLLAADLRLDADGIAIMGFSRVDCLPYASLSRFHALYGPKRGGIAALPRLCRKSHSGWPRCPSFLWRTVITWQNDYGAIFRYRSG
ncbi:hypothetical protein [Phyllobacterium bourgognense]|uniref:hypothetical protein n=1 Tax=Phyllobacterium bourgognense TaxID=314236 RepID=UPI0011C020B1|nr:hypothetical protein [Phyllobacterium bourgognense]